MLNRFFNQTRFQVVVVVLDVSKSTVKTQDLILTIFYSVLNIHNLAQKKKEKKTIQKHSISQVLFNSNQF